jgi:hypothetical protein
MEYYKNCVVGEGFNAWENVYTLLTDNKKVLWIDSSDFLDRLENGYIFEIGSFIVDEYIFKKNKSEKKELKKKKTLPDTNIKNKKTSKQSSQISNISAKKVKKTAIETIEKIENLENLKEKKINHLDMFLLDLKTFQKELLKSIREFIDLDILTYYNGQPEFSTDNVIGVHNKDEQIIFKYGNCDFVPGCYKFLRQDFILDSSSLKFKDMFLDKMKKGSYNYFITDSSKDIQFLNKLTKLGAKIKILSDFENEKTVKLLRNIKSINNLEITFKKDQTVSKPSKSKVEVAGSLTYDYKSLINYKYYTFNQEVSYRNLKIVHKS